MTRDSFAFEELLEFVNIRDNFDILAVCEVGYSELWMPMGSRNPDVQILLFWNASRHSRSP